MTNSEVPARLRWQCRRGMLELDVLLGNFLEEAYLSLDTNEQNLFVKLLSCEDQDLFEWLTGKKQPQEADLLLMVEKIRNHAQARH